MITLGAGGCSYKFSPDTSFTAWYQSLGIRIPRELGFR